MWRRGVIFIAILGALAVVVAGNAIAGSASGGKKVTVAHGRFAHRTWSLAVQRVRRQRCYELSLESSHSASAIGTCRPDVRPPLWSRLMGNSDLNNSATVELDVTRNRVRSMRLRIGHPHSNRPAEWIRVHNQRITRHEAHRADVRRDFRFAVIHSRGTLCVKRYVLFNRDGDRIERQRVPCEF